MSKGFHWLISWMIIITKFLPLASFSKLCFITTSCPVLLTSLVFPVPAGSCWKSISQKFSAHVTELLQHVRNCCRHLPVLVRACSIIIRQRVVSRRESRSHFRGESGRSLVAVAAGSNHAPAVFGNPPRLDALESPGAGRRERLTVPDGKLFLSLDALVSREHTATSVGWTSGWWMAWRRPPWWLDTGTAPAEADLRVLGEPVTPRGWLGFLEVSVVLSVLFRQSKGQRSEIHEGKQPQWS